MPQQKQRRHGAGMADINIRTTVAAKSSEEGDTGPAQGLPPSREEQEMRTREEYLREKALLDQEMEDAPEYLEVYVSQDLLSKEEAEQLHEIHSVDERLRAAVD